jgi:hypothetical protein
MADEKKQEPPQPPPKKEPPPPPDSGEKFTRTRELPEGDDRLAK